ncbi:MAG: cytoskeleton protein RodZ [Parvibaculaceae bacterium]|jgi:cytoskeleton protein RodZ|nr:DUF4115 domain-containing protein [Parvibaculaceae bacterium]
MNDRVVADKEAGAEKEQVDKLTLDEDRPEGARRIHLHDIQDDAEAEANAVDKADLVGAALRAQRLKQGLDLAQVSSDLKIRRPYLEALEDSRDSALPGRAYAIGFVRTYATYLGMDAKKIVDLFKVETDPETELVDERLAEEYPYVEAGPERRWPKGSLLILLLISFAAIYGAWQLSFSVDQMVSGRGASVSPSNSSTDAGVAPVASFPALGREAVVAETDPAGDGEEGETDVTLETLPTLTSPILTPPAGAQTPAVETEAVPLAEGNQYGVGGADETAASAGRVTLRALKNDSWLRVEAADGTALFSETLKAGDTYVTPDQQGLVMVARDAGAFEILVDEKSIGLAGPNGLVLTGLSLDPDDLGN